MSSPLRKKAKVECITIESDSDTTDGESTLEQRQQRRERKTVSAHRQRQAAASVTSSIGLTSCPDPEFGFKGHSSPSYVEGSRQYGRSPLHINAIPRLPRGSNVQTLSLSDLLSEGLVETWQSRVICSSLAFPTHKCNSQLLHRSSLCCRKYT